MCRVNVESLTKQLSEAGGQLICTALNFFNEALPATTEDEKSRAIASDLNQRFVESMSLDSEGMPQLTVTLPDESVQKSWPNRLPVCW